MKKINIGLDIGITSCGWSIIDEDNNLIDFGSRLFDEPSDAYGKLKNQERREKRSLRRRIQRVKVRKHDLFKLLAKYDLINKNITYEEFCKQINKGIADENGKELAIVELKVKGLKEKLKAGLIQCLFHYIHHRGYFFIDVESKEEKNIDSESISNEFPSVQQKKFFDENGWYVGSEKNLGFSNKKWLEEIKEFLKVQQLNPDFCEEYLKLFERVRNFAQGPGSEKSPTPYGLYRKEKGKIKKIGENLWDVTVGKCGIYPDELRGGKNSPIAEVYGLVQQLNLLYYMKDKEALGLTKEAKSAILDEFSKKLPGKNVEKKIMCIITKFIPEIQEFAKLGGVDPDRKPLFTELKNTIKIRKWLVQNEIESDNLDVKKIEDLNKINRVFEILAKSTDLQVRAKAIKHEYEKYNLPDEEIKKIAELSGLMTTSSYSYKAMREYIQAGLGNTDDSNQRILPQQFFQDKLEEHDVYTKLFLNKKYIPLRMDGEGLFDKEIISPTAKRSFIQTIKVLNRIIKLYSKEYQIDNIVIELARDNNTKEERDRIKESNKRNEKELDDILNDNKRSIEGKLNSNQRLKIRLWNEQKYQDIYDGIPIEFSDLMSHSSDYEIDHIMPFEDSCDDSRTNKVLTKKTNNWEKGKKSPWECWGSDSVKWTGFTERVNQLYKNSNPKKLKLLLYEGDWHSDEGFIERNLVDTRYASRLVLNILQKFFSVAKISNEDKSSENKIKLKVIRGPITNYARYNLFWSHFAGNEEPRKGIFKDRDLYEHHAVDATIIAFLGSQLKINKRIEIFQLKQRSKPEDQFDSETGEVIKSNFLFFSKEEHETIKKLSRQIEERITNKKCKFSRQSVVKNSVTLSNDTIYSMKWIDQAHTKGYKINKLNLLTTDPKEITKLGDYFGETAKAKENLLCYHDDKNLYDTLVTIYKENLDNPEIKNPFINYMVSKNSVLDNNPENENQRNKDIFVKALVINNYHGSSEDKRIKFLRYKSDLKNESNIILLKNHANKSFLESLNPLEVRIYKVGTGKEKKLLTFSVNALFLKSKNGKTICDETKLREFLIKKYPGIQVDDYIKIVRGQTLIDKKTKKNLFYFVGGGNFNVNALEIKPVFCLTEKYFNNPQKQIVVSTINNEYELCKTDELGNIYDIRPIYDEITDILGGNIYNFKAKK